MTTQNVADKRRPMSFGATRYLVSMAVAAAISGAALPQLAFAADPPAATDQSTAATPSSGTVAAISGRGSTSPFA